MNLFFHFHFSINLFHSQQVAPTGLESFGSASGSASASNFNLFSFGMGYSGTDVELAEIHSASNAGNTYVSSNIHNYNSDPDSPDQSSDGSDEDYVRI